MDAMRKTKRKPQTLELVYLLKQNLVLSDPVQLMHVQVGLSLFATVAHGFFCHVQQPKHVRTYVIGMACASEAV